MELIKITENDFNDVLTLSKQMLNHDNFLPNENTNFVDVLGLYVTSQLVCKATNGYFVINERNEKIALILYSVPNKPKLFSIERDILDIEGNELKKYCQENQLSPIESQVIKFEMDTFANTFEMYKKYNEFIKNKSEILLLYVNKNQRAKGIGKILVYKFYDELFKQNLSEFYLYTTSFFNVNFYEHLKMQGVSKVIYNKEKCPSFIKKKIQLPYVGMLFFGKITNRFIV